MPRELPNRFDVPEPWDFEYGVTSFSLPVISLADYEERPRMTEG
ncbi:MAG: hypothetical protein QOF01_3845 [Thermomicrobiales bacterium]|jgi:hypothetical protein|nr:hypothetical protein [Thermomicrobiales bacterium]